MVLNRVRLYTLPPLSLLAGSGLALALCLSLLLSSPIQRNSVFQKRDTTPEFVPDGYTHIGKAAPNETLELRMALSWGDRDGLEKRLYDVSDPKSANYGKFLTADEVQEYVRPSKETTGNVTQWLKDNGVMYEPMGAGEWLSVSASVSQIEPMLNASFHQYTHDTTGLQLIRSQSHEIPPHLKERIQAISRVSSFPQKARGNPRANLRHISAKTKVSRSMESRADTDSLQSCVSKMSVACIQDLYGLPAAITMKSRLTVAVEGFGAVPRQSNIDKFIQRFRPDVTATPTFQVIAVDGGLTTVSPPSATDGDDIFQGEANLDVESVLGIAPNASILFISGSPASVNDTDDSLESVIESNIAVVRSDPMPNVLTISFGLGETNLTETDIALIKFACDSFMQLGAQGTTVLVASGDGGVNGFSGTDNCTTFIAAFPASCPYVTAVGATMLNSDLVEVAANFTTGGFSDIFAMPDYQINSAEVSGYLQQLGDTNQGFFNTSGRGFPDISTVGVNVALTIDNDTFSVDGTSASSPYLAGIITLINDQLISANKSPLGFLNPLLYSGGLSGGLQDITEGNNPGCGTNGFPATPGWDAVSGFGSPIFPKMVEILGVAG